MPRANVLTPPVPPTDYDSFPDCAELKPAQAAEFLGLSERHLKSLRRGDGPPFRDAGHRTKLYPLATLRKYKAERIALNTYHAREQRRKVRR